MTKFNEILKRMKYSVSINKGLDSEQSKLNLSVGAPDLLPPREIFDSLNFNSINNLFNYKPSKGSIPGRENLHRIILKNDDSINPLLNICLCSGAKQGIYLTLKTCLNDGDKVLILQPYWLSYPDICESLNLKYSICDFDFDTLSYSIENIKKQVFSQNVKAVIINNPNNPSGRILSEGFLSELCQFLNNNSIWLILDEVYKDLTFSGISNLHNGLTSYLNVVRIGSMSKSMAIPGMRIGYVVGNPDFIENFNLFNQHINTCINSISTFVLESLTKESFESFVLHSVEIYKSRFDFVRSLLDKKGFYVIPVEASFYAMVNSKPRYNSMHDCINEFEQKGVIVTEGINYGSQFKDYFRICLTASETELAKYLIKI